MKPNFTVVPWTPELDLSEFYAEAETRGFENNKSQKVMIDCFKNEPKWAAWILYKDKKAVGSVAAHSFNEMGPNAYRVLARTCTFGTARQNKGLISPIRLIAEHQNLTDQFLLPTCIEWAKGEIYATSNESPIASQRLVHKYYFPILEKNGIAKRIKELNYRGTNQTVWQIFPNKFYEEMAKFPKWY